MNINLFNLQINDIYYVFSFQWDYLNRFVPLGCKANIN